MGGFFVKYRWLELLSLSGELTVAIHDGLRESAKEILTNKEKLIKKLEEQGIDDITKRKILNEINQIANVKTSNNLLNDFIELRAKYFNTSATAFNKLIKESLELKPDRSDMLKLNLSGIVSAEILSVPTKI